MTTKALDKAISIIGSMQAVADALGITKGAVSQWKDSARKVPAEHCPVIERLTKGVVRCEELRPDVDWAYLRNTPATPDTPIPEAIAEAESKRNGGIRQHGDIKDRNNISK